MKKGQKRGARWNIAQDGRVTVQFQLNTMKPEEQWVLDVLQVWRQEGTMKPSLMKAISLLVDIEQGQKEVINKGLLDHINSKIDLLLSRPLPQPADSNPSIGSAKPLGGLKPMAVSKEPAMPTFEDENDVLDVKKDINAGATASEDFLNAAFGMFSTRSAD